MTYGSQHDVDTYFALYLRQQDVIGGIPIIILLQLYKNYMVFKYFTKK